MKKKEIFQVAYQIATIICIYQVLKRLRMGSKVADRIDKAVRVSSHIFIKF